MTQDRWEITFGNVFNWNQNFIEKKEGKKEKLRW